MPPSRPYIPLARDHDLVVTYGNGPQVGLFALESAQDPVLSHPYPFDALGAQTQGMIWLLAAASTRERIVRPAGREPHLSNPRGQR